MQMQDAFNQLNWLAIVAAAVSIFIIGGLWYSLFFPNTFIAANNFTKEYLAKRNIPMMFGLSFLFSLIMALNLAMFIGKENTAFGATAGFMAGFGWVFFSIAIIALFEKRSLKYVLINGGYMIVSFTMMGFIIGAWK